MSGLKIGLVASCNDESARLVKLLEQNGVKIIHNMSPDSISEEQIADEGIHVWLLSVDDESWHDSVDQLLDESEVPVYFSDPGTLSKQTHPEYWCTNLVSRLFEITGLSRDEEPHSNNEVISGEKTNQVVTHDTTIDQIIPLAKESNKQDTPTEDSLSNEELPLESSLDQLEISTVGLPKNIAAELVTELESIAPVLQDELGSSNKFFVETVTPFESDELQADNISSEELEPEEIEEYDNEISDVEDDPTLDELELNSDDELDDFILESTELDNELQQTEIEDSAEHLEFDFDLSLESEDDSSSLELEEPFSNELVSDEIDLSEFEEFSIESTEPANADLSIDNFNFDESDTLESESEKSVDYEKVDFENFDIEEESSMAEEGNNSSSSPEIGKFELELESIEKDKPKITGRASYSIDEEEPSKTPASKKPEIQNSDSSQEEFGLTLEPIDQPNIPKGKAKFEIDDEDDAKPAEKMASSSTVKQGNLHDSLATGGLSLEEIQQKTEQPEWLKTNKDLELKSELNSSESLDEQQNDDAADLIDEVEEEYDLSSNEFDDEEDFLPEDVIAQSDVESDNFDIDGSDFNDEAIELESILDADIDTMESSELKLDQEAIQQLARQALDSVPIAKIQTIVEKTPEVFDETEYEIPMLDETAFNVEFEEKKELPNRRPGYSPCWVIGASLGGPAAVKRFLNCIPANINASLIIAQHIDENFLPVLAEILTNNSQFEVTIANGSNNLLPGKVYLAPLKGKLIILQDGSMLVDHSQKWSAPYSPCINDVIASVSQVYKELSGAIIFSGMGEDGLNGAKKMRLAGGQVWVQSTDTCANASMPEAVISNGEADFIGTPEQLAEKLIDFLKNQ